MDLAMAPIPVNAPRIVEFWQQRDLIWLAIRVIVLAVPLALLLTGWGTKLKDACARLVGGNKFLTLPLFGAAFVGLMVLILTPIGLYHDVIHPQMFNAPVSGAAEWLAERGVILVVQVVAAALLLWIPFAMIRRFPRFWWAPMSALLLLVVAVVVIGEQVVIRPMTTDYRPMTESALKARVDDLLARCSAEDTPILIGGDDATVVGLGPTARILLPEGFPEERTEDQALTTIAHEMKHYLLHDNWLAFGVVGGLLLGGTLLVHLIGGLAIRLWGGRFGFESLGDPAALPLIAAILFAGWGFLGQPAFNAAQKWAEWDADRFSLEATHLNYAQGTWHGGSAREINDYYRFFGIWRANHPSNVARVSLANTYKPWETGARLKFANVCEPPS